MATYAPPAQPASGSKSYTITHSRTHQNMRFHQGDSSSSPCVFYVNNSTWTPNTPDVQLRHGDNKEAPMIAFCELPKGVSRHLTLGLGDPTTQRDKVVYQELKRESLMSHKHYEFEVAEAILAVGADGRRKKFKWERKTKGLKRDYTCIDANMGTTVATFANAGMFSGKKLGTLGIVEGIPPNLELLIITSWAAIKEKERRAARASNAASGAGA